MITKYTNNVSILSSHFYVISHDCIFLFVGSGIISEHQVKLIFFVISLYLCTLCMKLFVTALIFSFQDASNKHTHSYIHSDTHMCTLIHTHMHLYALTLKLVHTNTHTHIHIYSHTHTHTLTHTRTYIHTHILFPYYSLGLRNTIHYPEKLFLLLCQLHIQEWKLQN